MSTIVARFSDRSAFKLPDSSTEEQPWIHIFPLGEHAGDVTIPKGTKVDGFNDSRFVDAQGRFREDTTVPTRTIFADDNVKEIIASFRGEMLCDYEHFSHDPDKATEAAGWGMALRKSADGAEVQMDWAGPAKDQIKNKVYRYISPEFDGRIEWDVAGKQFKFFPRALVGAGLTNRPKLTALRPVSANRDTNTKTTPTMDYKAELMKLLGLDAATATDQDITDKMAAFKPAASNELQTLRQDNRRLNEEMLEIDLERFAPVITDEDSAKDLLQTNRASAVKMFSGMLEKLPKDEENKGGTTTRVFQANRAKTPNGEARLQKDGEEQQAAATAKFRAVESRAMTLMKERNVTYSAAFSMAKAEAGLG